MQGPQSPARRSLSRHACCAMATCTTSGPRSSEPPAPSSSADDAPASRLTRPRGPIHRVGRRPDAWAWPDWSYAHDDGTFGNRYDDPSRQMPRPLRQRSPRAGALAETLARFRARPRGIAAELPADQRPTPPRTSDHPGTRCRPEPSPATGPGRARSSAAATHDGRVRRRRPTRTSLALSRARRSPIARCSYGLDDLDAGRPPAARPPRVHSGGLPPTSSSARATRAGRPGRRDPLPLAPRRRLRQLGHLRAQCRLGRSSSSP